MLLTVPARTLYVVKQFPKMHLPSKQVFCVPYIFEPCFLNERFSHEGSLTAGNLQKPGKVQEAKL